MGNNINTSNSFSSKLKQKCIPKTKSSIEKSSQFLGKSILNHQTCRIIGEGSYGTIYQAKNLQTKLPSALKIQLSERDKLFTQIEVYEKIQNKQLEKFPSFFGWGKSRGNNILIIELLDKNIKELFVKNLNKLSLKTIFKIGLEVLYCLQQLHELGYIHGDIKPQNIMLKANGKVTLIDFGFAEKYIQQNKHRRYRQGRKITGSIKYISISNHQGRQRSRRDDIESLGYVLLYLVNGRLPWQDPKGGNFKERLSQIMNKKQSSSLSDLCSKVPILQEFILYARNLSFEEKPSYSYLRKLLRKSCPETKLEDHKFQWEKE